MDEVRQRTWFGAVHGLRILFGAAYLFFGANFYLHLVDMGAARNPPFVALMADSGYFHLVKGTQVLGGALLLANRYVAIGLILLSAVTLNIVVFYLAMYRAEYEIATVFAAVNVVLLWAYRREFLPLLRSRVQPS